MRTTEAQRLAVEDRAVAALKEKGLLSTGQVRELCGPIYETFHEICSCRCGVIRHQVPGKVYDITRWAAPLILQILKRLERENKVLRIEPPQRNNGGGYQWLWLGE